MPPLEAGTGFPYMSQMNGIMARILIFRRHLAIMWRGFWHPATPFHLKAIMLGIVTYLVSPIDIVPDFLAILGWVDDILLVSLASNWIIRRLPPEVRESDGHQAPGSQYSSTQYSGAAHGERQYPDDDDGPVIDGTSRRL